MPAETELHSVMKEGEGHEKKVIGIIGTVVIVVIVAVFVLLANLGSIIKTAVNTYGPDITKAEIHLSDVDVSLLSAQATLRGFYLGNPGAFKSPRALAVASIYMDVDEKSLTSDLIIIDKIEVIAPEITYEKRDGTDNFKTILNNIKERAEARKGPSEKTEKKSEEAKEDGKKGERKKIVIRDVSIRDGRITLATAMLGGKKVTVPLPDIHLTNIGQKRGGLSPAEAAREILAALYEKIAASDITNALNDQLKKLGSTLGGTKKAVTGQAAAAGEEAEQRVKALRDKIKGFRGE